MDYSVVIVAAGQGKRMKAGKNKLLLPLRQEPVIIHTVRVFERDPSCRQIVLVTNQEEIELMKELIKQHQITKVIAFVIGGNERQHSVKNGIEAISGEGIVLIHDGARPFIHPKTIHILVKKASEQGAATVGVPVKDTIKRVTAGQVKHTLNRSELWAVQTPQAFSLPLLKMAHDKAEDVQFLGTDDASLIEWIGHDVVIVEGDYHNIKLTTPEDLVFAEAIMQEREK
ncbi:2-C-methyl-D-erythritol 4-phosphate cytidylyltransferase [Bacillus suaedae]|uniref:2-C-methyl-D-erythritol 4-phosphate cytidylyltransferase n=1 Tax=Halalkalibacter suaedae TaxID=2822140 RepID=A0A941AQY6_9BACI|nr:2-C-methyl-D-erythritol 4-phosphate cytidylyltransferase [Bacillus suaedae]